jgi:hypothetical protein
MGARKPALRASIVPRTKSLLIHSGPNGEYCSTVEYLQIGSKARLYSLAGKDFYAYMQKHCARLMRKEGVKELDFPAFPSHIRLIKLALRNQPVIVSEGDPDTVNGVTLQWMSILLL